MPPYSPTAEVQARKLAYDAMVLEILRSQSGTLTAAKFLESCETALAGLLGAGRVWIVAFETPSDAGDSRDNIVASVISPRKSSKNFPHLMQTSGEILDSGEFWIQHVPFYVRGQGERKSTVYEYALLRTRSGAKMLSEESHLLLHAATALGNALTVVSENTSLREAIKVISGRATLTRLADEVLGYEMLERTEEIKGWKSISVWRYSRTGKTLEKLSEKNCDGSRFVEATIQERLLFDLLKEAPMCNVICIEKGESISGRAVQLISSMTGKRGKRLVEGRTCGSDSERLQIAVPIGIKPLSDLAWERLEKFCRYLAATMSGHTRSDETRFSIADTICILPFKREREEFNQDVFDKQEVKSNDTFEFEAATVIHLGQLPIRAAHVSFIRSFADRCVGTQAGLSRTHERLELLAEQISSLQGVHSFDSFNESLETISTRLFDGSAVVLWKIGLGTVRPQYRSPSLEGVSLEAAEKDIRLRNDEPKFFGFTNTASRPWLGVVEERLKRAPTRPKRRNASITGYMIPARTAKAYYLIAVVRSQSTRQREMDIAFCHALQPLFATILDRLESKLDIHKSGIETSDRRIDEHDPHRFCALLKSRTEADSVLLLYADDDLNALSLSAQVGASEQANQIGLLLPSAPTLANKCYSEDKPLYAIRIDRELKVQPIDTNGQLEPGVSVCPYLGWLSDVAWAIAAPIHIGTQRLGVVVVAWGGSSAGPALEELSKRYRQVSETCEAFGKLKRDDRLEAEDAIRDQLKNSVYNLRRVPAPSLAPDMPKHLLLPPELDQLFPSSFRVTLTMLLEQVVMMFPCLSVTVRLPDHSRSALHLLCGAGIPSAQSQHSLKFCDSVSAFAFLNHQDYPAISLPRIRNGVASVDGCYPGLKYNNAREQTRSQLCLPLLSGTREQDCLGTISFESDHDHGFQTLRGSCEELRQILQDVIERRTSSAKGELLRHIEYMGHLFAQEHHALKDRLSFAEDELVAAESGNAQRVREVFAVHRTRFLERIRDLGSLSNSRNFNPSESVRRVLSRVTNDIERLLDIIPSIEQVGPTYGNPWLFEHAVENTLWQIVTFLRHASLGSYRYRIHILLKEIDGEASYLLAIAHNGPAMNKQLAPFLFWYKIHQSDTGAGMGLALTGFEYRSMDMYPRASGEAPPQLRDGEYAGLASWFYVLLPREVTP